ncbi:hypothetical protein K3727_20340 [Rhodobacteraceae bacterium M382]|nr:hypothetical protein K3727_20340 [Rhodobacteraceae bacterium M382]
MRRIVVHPGFHKTATTTVQTALAAQADLLSPHVQLVFRDDILSAARSAQAYSKDKDPLTLAVFLMEFASVLEACDPDDPRPMLISTEDLCGFLVGRHGVRDYSAAPALMQAICTAITEVMGPSVELLFYLSTRRSGWLDSCYWQLLRAGRLTIPLDAFVKQYGAAADLSGQVEAIRQAIHPITIRETALEDMTGPLGPLGPVFDLLGLPAHVVEALTLPVRSNVQGSPDLRDELLSINQSTISDREAERLRRQLLRKSWTRLPKS